MARTFSRFLYGWRIFSSGPGANEQFDFVDNGSSFRATLNDGIYTAAELAAEVQRAMRDANTDNNNNTCTFSFSTRKFTLTGTATFSLEWNSGTNAGKGLAAQLGFDDSSDDTGATSYTSDSAVGGTHSNASEWTMAEPNDPGNTPVTAKSDGTAADRLQRDIRAIQNRSDGGKIETLYIDTVKRVRIGFRVLSSSEQTNMESLLDWIEQGRRFNWIPDKDTPGDALRLVLEDPRQINNDFEWRTVNRVSYGVLSFIEQLSRT